ncbi:hypothetical protein L596_029274 [Steinernema carpocapsae]|uniref:Uncharacterized protein n=1 Tax=Steinernema carpocapsae TaxID=34508 RepID=A0A4U5LU54_STECR|nr:hypothetical protein L596_029274 [Steinernema carpocapsae]
MKLKAAHGGVNKFRNSVKEEASEERLVKETPMVENSRLEDKRQEIETQKITLQNCPVIIVISGTSSIRNHAIQK